MKNILFLLIFLSTYTFSQEYKPFTGKLTYSVDFYDSLHKKPMSSSFMKVYTNDTIVRIEAESDMIGKQIIIRHMILNKYYILLQMNEEKFAIQHQGDNDTVASKYNFDYKIKSKKVCGMKAKKVVVKSVNLSAPMTMYYLKDYNPKYLEAMKGIRGLPVDYYIQTNDGYFHYKLTEFSSEKVSNDLFGISSDYKKVTFDEFMQSVMDKN